MRLLHWLAGLFCGWLLWINPIVAILLSILFNWEQVTNEYAQPNPIDFDRDVWDFMFCCFIGAGLGFLQFYLLKVV